MKSGLHLIYIITSDVFLFCQDLGSSDLRKDVYIVVHIIRIGGSYNAASLFN